MAWKELEGMKWEILFHSNEEWDSQISDCAESTTIHLEPKRTWNKASTAKMVLSSPIHKIEEISRFQELAFWIRYEGASCQKQNHFCYLQIGNLVELYGIPFHEPGVWHYIRVPLQSFEFVDKKFLVKPWPIPMPERLNMYLFASEKPITLKLGSFYLVRYQLEQDVQEGLRQLFNEMRDQIRHLLGKEFMIETWDAKPKENTQGGIVLQLRTYTIKPDAQRQTWEEEKDTFVYFLKENEIKLSVIGVRPPAHGYEVYTNLHIMVKDPDTTQASLRLKDFILQYLTKQRWISIAGRKVPIFLAPQSPENNEKQQDPWENPFLRIKTATWQEAGERQYYPRITEEEILIKRMDERT